jgi:hypothetical protein
MLGKIKEKNMAGESFTFPPYSLNLSPTLKVPIAIG